MVPATGIPVAIGRALRLIEAHPSVTGVVADIIEGNSIVVAVVSIKTELPADWRAAGTSPSGVRVVEPVVFRFDERYPVYPPDIRLRRDFERSHPHLQPGPADESPEPCLFAGSPRELLRLRGMFGLLEQLVEWLERAALVQLIDPKQGWGPVRRDHIDDVIVSEADWLRGMTAGDAGCSALKLRYLAAVGDDGSANYWVTMRKSSAIAIGPDLSSDFTFRRLDHARMGGGIGLVAWSGKKGDGKPFVADRYMPETVFSVADLLARADVLGCREHLQPKLALLQKRFRQARMKVPVPLAVVMVARRPYPVIGSSSVWELCPYVVELDGNDDLSNSSAKTVRPAMHREDISPSLLRRASGNEDVPSQPRPWTLVGCGSVGSKIALHMARTGSGPAAIVDHSNMLPHNYARHATYPQSASSDYGLLERKTVLLGDALAALGQAAQQHPVDVVAHMMRKGSLAPIVEEGGFAVVNTTGSATVRESLASAQMAGVRPRVVEACLLGVGKAGLMTVEGPDANPSTADLICECYREIHSRTELAADVFGSEAAQVAVGQGCSAMTLPISDSRLSIFSAALAEKLAAIHSGGMPDDGGLLILGHLKDDGLSQTWTEEKIPPRIVVGRDGGGEIRIAPKVHAAICKEIGRKAGSETGGIIYGRFCDITDSFHVVGTLPAPPDSKFSSDEFVLGIEGLKPMLKDLIEGSGGALYPLGTWHNHLFTSGPSAKDTRTGILLSGMQYFPLLILIHTPGGYRAISVETVRDVRLGAAAE